MPSYAVVLEIGADYYRIAYVGNSVRKAFACAYAEDTKKRYDNVYVETWRSGSMVKREYIERGEITTTVISRA